MNTKNNQETKRNECVLCTCAGSNLAKKAIFQMIRSKEGCDEASNQRDYTLLLTHCNKNS